MGELDTYLFHEGHLWCRPAGDGTLEVGISDHAQQSLGDILYFELPETGAKVTAGVSMGTVESVKVVNDLIAPVTGVVSLRNDQLEEEPGLANRDPYQGGWLVRITPDTDADTGALMNPEQYQRYHGYLSAIHRDGIDRKRFSAGGETPFLSRRRRGAEKTSKQDVPVFLRALASWRETGGSVGGKTNSLPKPRSRQGHRNRKSLFSSASPRLRESTDFPSSAGRPTPGRTAMPAEAAQSASGSPLLRMKHRLALTFPRAPVSL